MDNKQKSLALVALTALGVVYGDIGTSPLYAFRECFQYLPANVENVLGILSLIFWSFVIVVSVKYLLFVLRADKDGQGGTLVLLALLDPTRYRPFFYSTLLLVGIIGASLLYGDGMLTPAISVLGAVEGLSTLSHTLSGYILPLTTIVLIALFIFQKHGTFKIGITFGPIMLLWFGTIATLGLLHVLHNVEVLKAINPIYAFYFFYNHGWVGYLVLGGVFLVMTGAEALYADLGHFGKRPIRCAWFVVVMPALVLNYFGQGANILANPAALENPFYSLAPKWFLLPLLLLATIAAIIASQAVISAAFSLTRQAVLMRFFPKVKILQTSSEEKGQVYVPSINWILALGTLLLIFYFKSSSNLAHAYGIAVNFDMLITTLLVFFIFCHRWKWSIPTSVFITSFFFLVDISFLGANLHKLEEGGWVPLLIATLGTTVMLTWRKGMERLAQFNHETNLSIDSFLSHLSAEHITRIPGTALFVTENQDEKGGSLLHHLKLNQILHEKVIILSITIVDQPSVKLEDRITVQDKGGGFYRVWLRYGFMQTVDIPNTLRVCSELHMLPFLDDPDQIVYYVETIKLSLNVHDKSMMPWRKRLFAFMQQNVSHEPDFYRLPVNRTIAIGAYYEI